MSGVPLRPLICPGRERVVVAGEHRFDGAANNLVDAALFDDALFYEAANTLGGIARKQNSAI